MADDKGLQTELERLQAEEIEELRGKLAQYEGDRIVQGEFGEVPRYHLNEAVYIDNEWIEEGSEIEYTGEPSETAMVPLNDAAKRKMEERFERLENAARNKAELVGRPYTGLTTDKGTMIAQALQDARLLGERAPLTMPEKKENVPVMPHTPEAQAVQRRRGRPPKKSLVSHAVPKAKVDPNKPAPILGSYQRASGEGSVG